MSDQAAFLSTKDAAALLGVHIDTLRNYIRRGLIRRYRIRGSRLLRFRVEDLRALVEEVPPSAEQAGRLRAVR